ncbi:MAG: GMC family oxidoreductase N-terminal domain-containing protein [Chthoniobacterales bacterium]|nr:GMC family oxidoreductase N-terminal domain-containing protein [Chthoniobacterales bacterium]
MDKVGKRNGIRQTMSRPNLPRALAAGAKILTGWRAQRIQKSRLVWSIEARQQNGERRLFLAQKVLLCGGAIQTPLLLHRSSIRGCIFALPTLFDAFMASITSLLTMLASSQQHLALIHKVFARRNAFALLERLYLSSPSFSRKLHIPFIFPKKCEFNSTSTLSYFQKT